jgi:hypothetical protein
MEDRLQILVESRIRWKVYVRFGGEHLETCYSNIIRRRVLSLHFQVDRPLVYRFFGLGNLIVYTSDKTSPVFRLEAIRRPEEIYTILRERVEQNRREKHVFEVD